MVGVMGQKSLETKYLLQGEVKIEIIALLGEEHRKKRRKDYITIQKFTV